ncbi:MAG: S-layer homology domain-containing protein [Peptostreptococcaceae bacterium]|nr:S-layer homology domain-containing protein [Peptostreptococcaceae bacterium]
MKGRKALSFILVIVLTLGSFTTMSFGATASTTESSGVRYEIEVAVDPSNTNINYSNLEADLKSKVVSEFNNLYGSSSDYTISPDSVVINFVQPSNIETSNEEAWDIYDHYYSPTYELSSKTTDDENDLLTLANREGQPFYYYRETSYYNDGKFYTSENVGNDKVYLRDKHIYPNGSRITFMGYGDPGMNDFMIYPDQNTQDKTIDYTIYENSILLHTFEGAGFLINAGISGGAISGYILYSNYKNKNIELYKVDGLDVDFFHSRVSDSTAKEWPLSSFITRPEVTKEDTKPSKLTSINIKNIRIEVSNDKISYYEINPNTLAESVVYDDYAITPTGISGYGPLVSYTGVGHSCTQLSSFVFENININSNATKTFDQKILEPKWHEGAIHALINIDNSGIVNFDNNNSRTEMVMKLIDDDVNYIGWGDSSHEDQEMSFIKENNNKGIFVNTSTSAVNFSDGTTVGAIGYNEQVTKIAKYLVGMIDPDLTKVPVVKIAYNGTTLSSISTDPNNGTIVEENWSIKEADSPDWQTTTDVAIVNTSLAAMKVVTGTSKNILVQLVVKDDQNFLSSPDVIYLSNDQTVKPIAAFTIDESLDLENSSTTSITPDDLSFDPLFSQRSLSYSWKVYNEMGQLKRSETGDEPAFDFAGLPSGRYDISLTVSGNSIESNTFTQTLNIIDTVAPSLNVGITGNSTNATATFKITDNGSGPDSYRITTTAAGTAGTKTIGPWVPAVASNTITKTYTFKPSTLQGMAIEVKDGSGNTVIYNVNFDIPLISYTPNGGNIFTNDLANNDITVEVSNLISSTISNWIYIWSTSSDYVGDSVMISNGTSKGSISRSVVATPGNLGDYYLHVYAINSDDTISSGVSEEYTFGVDNTSPAVPKIVMTDSDNDKYTPGTWTPLTVTVTLSNDDDNGSTIVHKYKIKEDSGWTTGDAITFSTDGVYNFIYKAVDSAGNESSTATAIIKRGDYTEPMTLTSNNTAVGRDRATLTGEILNLGTSGTLSEYGFVYSNTSNPSTANSKVTLTGLTGAGIFNTEITGLYSNTTYYCKAYAIDSDDTYYSDQITFKTDRRRSTPLVVTDSGITTEPGIEGPIATEPAIDNNGAAVSFADVGNTRWFYEAVEYTAEKGLMVGIKQNDGTVIFDPLSETSRGMIAAILYRLEGQPTVIGRSDFSDVREGSWYDNSIAWAVKNNIVDGYLNGTYAPTNNISRQELASILYRYSEYKGYNLTANDDLGSFADAIEVSNWALQSVEWAAGAKLISGITPTLLDTRGFATRAQVAAVLMTFTKNVAK